MTGGGRMAPSPLDRGRGRPRPADRRRLSGHGVAAILAMLAPAILFPIGLRMLRSEPRFASLDNVADYPWESG